MTVPEKRRVSAGLGRTIPALPVRDVGAAVVCYRERFGFDVRYRADDFAALVRHDAVIHLWAASDGGWRARGNVQEQPLRSGAESFLAGTASCRIEVADVDGLFDELRNEGVIHGVQAGVTVTDFGRREFQAIDLDGNLLTFLRWEGA